MRRLIKTILATLVLCSATSSCEAKQPDEPVPAPEGNGGYLMAHMSVNSNSYGNIYYSVSRDGQNWTRLYYNGYRICGFKGHPDLCKGGDGKWLSIGMEEERPVLWESPDLVHWNIRMTLDGDIFSSKLLGYSASEDWYGNPRLFYDDETGKYLITWQAAKNGLSEASQPAEYAASLRTLCRETTDFESFSQPRPLFDSGSLATSDLCIRKVGNNYFCFFTGQGTDGTDIYLCETTDPFGGKFTKPTRITDGGDWSAPGPVAKDDDDGWLLLAHDKDGYSCFTTGAGTDARFSLVSKDIPARYASVVKLDEKDWRGVLDAFGGEANAGSPAGAGVEVKANGEGGFDLFIDGKQTYIKGQGQWLLAKAHERGSNAMRTWKVDNIEELQGQVKEAEENGMHILVGLTINADGAWNGESESTAIRAQRDKYREYVLKIADAFKDDDRIFAWALGNELNMNAPESGGENWKFIDELAVLIKSVDKRHLVGSVISHDGAALNLIGKYCPHFDFVGINSYYGNPEKGDPGIADIKPMVAKSEWKGPYMITEFGTSGYWQVDKTSWGTPIEATEEEKRQQFEKSYEYIQSDNRCIGSFCFKWNSDHIETTQTWFTMFGEAGIPGLPLNGEMKPTVEAMERMWTGKEPRQHAPKLTRMTINGLEARDNVRLGKDAAFTVAVEATDQDGDGLKYYWEILTQAEKRDARGQRVGKVVETDTPTVSLSGIPSKGKYRVFVYITDGTGYMTDANIPVLVE